MPDELISINVWLANRTYRIRIRQEEEEAVRKAIKLADDKIADLRNNYAGKDDQDFIAMCLLSYAADSAVDVLNNPLLKDEFNTLSLKIDEVLKG